MGTNGFMMVLLIIGINTTSKANETIDGINDVTTQSYNSQDDKKCMKHSAYSVLVDCFIKHVAGEIQRNHTNEAMDIFNAVDPEDVSKIERIVDYTVNRNDFKLFYLIQFISLIPSPSTRLSGFNYIFSGMNKNGTRSLLDWLNLEYFVSNSSNEFKFVEDYNVLLSEIKTSAKSTLMNLSNYTVIHYFNQHRYNRDDSKYYEPHHLSFILEVYFENNTDVVRFIESLSSFQCRLKGFTDIYDRIDKSGRLNNTFKLIPALKPLYTAYTADNEFFKKINSSVIKKVLSDEFYLIRNVYDKGYLYIKHISKRTSSNRKSSNFLRTVQESNLYGEFINWKFYSRHIRQKDKYLLTLSNEINQKSAYDIRPVQCEVHDQSILQMGNDHNDNIIDYAWSLETDDFYGDSFRIKNEYTGGYLAVRVNNDSLDKHLPSNVILVSELNAENFNSAHWTLEPPVDD